MSHAAVQRALSATALRAELARTGCAEARLEGRSMRPLLRDGATVRLRAASVARLRAGELVALARGHAVVLHRLRAVHGDSLVTHGDAEPEADPAVSTAALLGVVTALRAPGGAWLPPPSGRLLGAAVRLLWRARRGVARARRRLVRVAAGAP